MPESNQLFSGKLRGSAGEGATSRNFLGADSLHDHGWRAATDRFGDQEVLDIGMARHLGRRTLEEP